MSDIFLFKSKDELTAAENLESFVNKCRYRINVFGSDLNWDLAVWPNIAVFAKLGVKTRKPKPEQLMDKTFIDFAKAYLRYQQGHKPTETKNEGKALRAVEAALIQVNGSADISQISITVLDEAATLIREVYSEGACYQCGREIKRLADFISENRLVPTDLQGWVNPIQRLSDKNKTGKSAKADREKRLPNKLALNALAELFSSNPSHGRDIFTTSTFAMLMSAPSRISEVLALPVDCEVTEKDSDGIIRYGWRFYSGKGYGGDIKWIPTEMVEIAKSAIARIKLLSKDARDLAKWIEEKPKDVYRHSNCPNVNDDVPLSMVQACQFLGLVHEDTKACRTSLVNRKLKPENDIHTLKSLWDHVLERLPKDFPWYNKSLGIKYSNALFVLNKYQFHGSRGLLPLELYSPDANFFNNDLSPRESLHKGVHRSIFDRHGYYLENGDRLKITSHQVRHLLNTIAQRGGLSNLEIAKWSGRADVKQNRTYNHMTEYELIGIAERLDPSKSMFGPAGEVVKHEPVTMQEFNTLEHAAVHVTEFGYCVHDYILSPCEKYRDCVNCTEQVCIKGDEEKLTRLKERLSKSEKLFSIAEKDISEGNMGVDRWYQSHEKKIKRLRELVSILENPDIEDGAQVKLRGNDFSQLRRVRDKKAIESSTLTKDEDLMLKDLSNNLGGSRG